MTTRIKSESDIALSPSGLVDAVVVEADGDLQLKKDARLPNNQSVIWRNAANSADLPLVADTSNNLRYNSLTLVSASLGLIPLASIENGGGGGGSGFTLALRTTTFTAATNTQYLVDTSSTAFTGTLPAGTAQYAIRFSDDQRTWGVNNFTIQPATGEKIDGFAIDEPLICDLTGANVQLSWDGSKWIVDTNVVLGANGNGQISSIMTSEKNYVTRPDNANADWVSSNVALVTVATENTSSNLPESATKTTAIRVTRVSGTTGYIRYRFVADPADLTKKFKLQWNHKYAGTTGDYTVEAWSFSASDYTTGPLQMVVQNPSIPQVTNSGTFVSSFDTISTTQKYIEIRIVAVAGTTPIYISGVVVGPGIIAQMPAISDWQTYVPTITASTPPTRGTNTEFAYWRRIGSEMELLYEINQTAAGTTGSGTYFWSLPAGYTADGGKIALALGNNVGHAYAYNGTQEYNGLVSISNTGTTFLIYIQTALNTYGVLSSATVPFGNTVFRLWCSARIPIAEWAGNGTVNLGAGPLVEFAHSTNTVTTAGNTQADDGLYGYGPLGTTFLAIDSVTLSSQTIKRVRFQYPIQNDDMIIAEYSVGIGFPWFNINDGGFKRTISARAIYGMQLFRVNGSPTDVLVFFGNAGASSSSGSATAYEATNTDPWSGYVAQRWRLRKTKASSPVGFGLAGTDGSFGLYGAGRAPGIVAGQTIASGNLGETIEGTASTALSAATDVYQDITSIPLTPGKWRIDMTMFLSANATNASTRWIIFIGSVAGNNTTGQSNTGNRGEYTGNSSNVNSYTSIPGYIVNISSNTTYYAKVAMSYTTLGSVSCNGRITAQRIG